MVFGGNGGGGAFPHEPAEAKAEGKAEEEGEERPPLQNAAEMKRENGNGSLQKMNKKTDGQLVRRTQRLGVFLAVFFLVLFCFAAEI